jgi:hypothetical protein
MGADYDTAEKLKIAPERLWSACHLDLGRGVRDTTLVVSTGRSGSTWVAEIVNYRREYRLVFEPFRSDRVRRAREFKLGQYIDPAEQAHPLAPAVDALLAGRVRNWWTDRQNPKHIARRRIVKEIRITNLIPWIRARHPRLRIVYVVRDPVTVARSWLELDWSDGLADFLGQDALLARFDGIADQIVAVARRDDRFDRLVLRWCLENAIPLRAQPSSDVHLIEYEQLRDEPGPELARLFAYLGEPGDGALEAVRKPSQTAGFPRRGGRVEIDDARRHRARELLELFELEPYRTSR